MEPVAVGRRLIVFAPPKWPKRDLAFRHGREATVPTG